jgi:hypothetical protein
MDELQTILGLKAQVSEDIRRAESKLRALEIVEKMIRDSKQPGAVIPIQPKLYASMRQDDAIRDVLKTAAHKLTAREVAEALQRGGFKFKTDNPTNSLFATMNTNRKGLYTSEKVGSQRVFGLAEEAGSGDSTKAV